MWIAEFKNYFRLKHGQLQFTPSLEIGWDDVEREFTGWDVVMQILGA